MSTIFIVGCTFFATAMIAVALGGAFFSRRQQQREKVKAALQLTPQGKSATQAIMGATDFLVAVALAKQKGVAPYRIVATMRRDWGATPSQVASALMSLGSPPESLNHPRIISFDELAKLVKMLNAGEQLSLPKEKLGSGVAPGRRKEKPKTAHGMQAVVAGGEQPQLEELGHRHDPNAWQGILPEELGGDGKTIH